MHLVELLIRSEDFRGDMIAPDSQTRFIAAYAKLKTLNDFEKATILQEMLNLLGDAKEQVTLRLQCITLLCAHERLFFKQKEAVINCVKCTLRGTLMLARDSGGATRHHHWEAIPESERMLIQGCVDALLQYEISEAFSICQELLGMYPQLRDEFWVRRVLERSRQEFN